jgi:hypothetical protein
MKFDQDGNTLKHPGTINGTVKNLSKWIEEEINPMKITQFKNHQ